MSSNPLVDFGLLAVVVLCVMCVLMTFHSQSSGNLGLHRGSGIALMIVTGLAYVALHDGQSEASQSPHHSAVTQTAHHPGSDSDVETRLLSSYDVVTTKSTTTPEQSRTGIRTYQAHYRSEPRDLLSCTVVVGDAASPLKSVICTGSRGVVLDTTKD